MATQQTEQPTTAMVSLCGVCRSPVSSQSQECSKCERGYHQDCWEYTGGRCAIFGCIERQEQPPNGFQREGRTYFVVAKDLFVADARRTLEMDRYSNRMQRKYGFACLGIGLFIPTMLGPAAVLALASWLSARRIGGLEQKFEEYKTTGRWVQVNNNGSKIEYLPNGSVILIPTMGGG